MEHPGARHFRFGMFEADPISGELSKSGRRIPLQDQPLQVLFLLLERAGTVVRREELHRALWPADTFVEFDQGLNTAIKKLRLALGDSSDNPRFIETLPRKGYRFIAPVTGPAAVAPVSPQAAPQVVKPTAVPGLHGLTGRWIRGVAALAGFAALLIVASNAGGWRDRLLRQPAVKSIESLAVLPLENLSHDSEQDYFADGMTDELITDLAKISALRVIPRTSVMQYKGTKKPIAEIARELNVDAVLEGTVTRDQGRVRITAQLIRAAPETHLWAEKYEASLGEVLTVQDAVAKAVAQEIQIKITPRDRTLLASPPAIDPAAHDAYLKGRYLWWRSGEENLPKSREYFQQAIELDPGYALAWAGLADTYNRLASWGVISRQDAAPRARAAAEKALELDNSLVGPLATLADVKEYEWDWAGAERLWKRSIELSPNNGTVHHQYATYLAEMGRVREAVAEARRAREVDPLSGLINANVVWKLYLARQYNEAELEARRISGWQPQVMRGYILASVYLQTGRQREAVANLKKLAESNPAVLQLMFLGHALGVTGAQAEGQKVLEEMRGLSQRRYVPPDYIAMVFEGLGERDRALQWFEKACAERSMNGWLLPDPRLDQIRMEPRFKNLMRRMGLPQ